MSNETVNVPGGPAYVFGKKNTAHTGPQSASEESRADGDIQSVIDEINANSGARMMTADTAADAAHDAMSEALDKYWNDYDSDASDKAMEYADKYLPSQGGYSEEDREEYIGTLVGYFEDNDEISSEVSANVYYAINKKGMDPNHYTGVSFSNDDVERYFDDIAKNESENYDDGDDGRPNQSYFL